MNTQELKELLLSSKFEGEFTEIYSDVEAQAQRYLAALNKFEELFGQGEVLVYSTPGRSEIAGNHTDHQHGKVIAAAIDLDTVAFVRKNSNNIINLKSDGYNIKPVDLNDLEIKEQEAGTSEALIRGMAQAFKNHNLQVGGFDAYIISDVLSGSGLSSSAAFEVLVGKILSDLYNNDQVSAIDIAKYAQYSENVYFKKPSGLMDQMACSVGNFVYIDFFDKANPKVEALDFKFDNFDHKLVIVDTKGDHADLTDDYAAITREMRAVANFFGKEVLTEVDPQEFFSKIKELREKVNDRAIIRAIHLFKENKRVESQVKNIMAKDFESFKKLIKESGHSSYMYLQNIFSLKHPERQEISLALAVAENTLDGKGAYRVHGGGFAGTIQAIVPNEEVDKFLAAMKAIFGDDSCYVLNIRKGSTRVF